MPTEDQASIDQATIYRFYFDYGRMGYLSGLFVATPRKISKAYGLRMSFGEALGKHSEVSGEFGPENVSLVEQRPEFVNWFRETVEGSGYDPLEDLYDEDWNQLQWDDTGDGAWLSEVAYSE